MEKMEKRKKKQMFCEKSCLVFLFLFGTIDPEKRKRGKEEMKLGRKEFLEKLRQEMEKQTRQDVVTGEMLRVGGGTTYFGLIVLGKEDMSWPLLYVDQVYFDYQNGREFSSIVEELLVRNEKRKERKQIQSYFVDFKKAKPNLCYQLVNRERHLAFLGDRPHESFFNLEKLYGILTEEKKGWRILLDIRKCHLEKWGISEQELKQQAEENMSTLLPIQKRKFQDFFSLSSEQENTCDAFLKSVHGEEQAEHLFILSNSLHFYGASVFTYPNVWKEIAEEWNDHLVISPNSVHELTVRPLKEGKELLACVMALRERNVTRRMEEEFLGNHVYLYEKGTGHIMVV